MRLYIDVESWPRDPAERVNPAPCGECGHVKHRVDPFRHQPLVISWAWNDEPVQSVASVDEFEVLDMFHHALVKDSMSGNDAVHAQWIAHNGPGFDLRLLHTAARRHGFGDLAGAIPTLLWDKRAVCTMKLAMAADPRGYISLDNLAQALGHEGKGDVADIDFPTLWAWGAGCLPTLVERCEVDVELTRWVHKRLTGRE